MPQLIPVAAAIWSVGAAYTATAGFTIAMTTAMSTFQIIGTVSAVVGAVGAVTKNKTLQTIGLIGGAVGAIGSFAQASGLLEGVGLAKESGAAFNKAFTSGDLFNKSGGGTLNAGAPSVGVSSDAKANVTTSGDVGDGGALAGETGLEKIGRVYRADGATAAAAVGGPAVTPITPDAGTLVADTSSGFLKFAKDNGTLVFTGATVLGNAAAGLFDPTVEGTVAKTEAEAALLKTQNDVLAQQKANMAGALPEFRPSPVTTQPFAPQPTQQIAYAIDPLTGKAVAPKPIAQGLINANTVTGVPA